MDDPRARLIRCFSAVFPGLDEPAIPHASRAAVAGWDSLANFSLITVIEEEFGIQIEPDDVARFSDFESILGYVTQKI
jgi:acyl carrier protein